MGSKMHVKRCQFGMGTPASAHLLFEFVKGAFLMGGKKSKARLSWARRDTAGAFTTVLLPWAQRKRVSFRKSDTTSVNVSVQNGQNFYADPRVWLNVSTVSRVCL